MSKFAKKIPFLFCLCFLTFSLSAQWYSGGIRGEGPSVTKSIDLEKINGFSLGVPGDVHLMEGKRQKIEIRGQKNIIDNIERDIRNGVWKIEFDKNVRKMDDLDIYITLPSFRKLSIAGSGSIIGKDAFNNLGDLKVSIAGSGEIELEGSADRLEVSIAGSGDVQLSDLKVEDCKVSIAGSGDCEINVTSELDVSIAGSGDVKYKGDPDKVKSSIAGSGDVRSMKE